MYDRIKLILKKIEHIETIIDEGSITEALSDEITKKPAILMHLVSIAEQFKKLQDDLDLEILAKFDKEDVRGALAIRNFIAHDYEGVNMAIVEDVIRIYLPKVKQTIEEILSTKK